jgi:glutathionylspermidine synthase
MIVEASGLAYAVDPDTGLAYWHEQHAYELDESEVDYLERLTEELHRMSCDAAGHLLAEDRLWVTLGLPPEARSYLAASLATERGRSLYGRFDLAWDGEGPAMLLEYNADTPAGLVEAAVTQWEWLNAVRPRNDQWNMLHERLVKGWRELGQMAAAGRVHLAYGQNEPTEDWVTVAYLADTAVEAGLDAVATTMESLGWDGRRRRFVDDDGVPIDVLFKMYPWEWMFTEPFGRLVLGGDDLSTMWLEPAWKTLLGSKTLLVALHECFPGHESVLPAMVGEPGPWRSGYVAKPVYGWEGAGIQVVTPDFRHTQDAAHTGGQALVYQQYTPLGSFDGAHPVLGTWVIRDRSAGLGIREQDGPVTDTNARFVPHYMTSPRSTSEQVDDWLRE